MKWVAAFLCLHAAAAAKAGHGAVSLDAPAPAPAKAAKKDTPALEALHIKFEISNFNYFDLTKETCPEKVTKLVKLKPNATKLKETTSKDQTSGGEKTTSKKQKTITSGDIPKDETSQKTSAVKDLHDTTDSMANQVQNGLAKFGNQEKPPKPPWMNKKKKKQDGKKALLLQIGSCSLRQDLGETDSMECTTVMDVLRDAIRETVKGIITCLYQQKVSGAAPGPAPMSNSVAPEGPVAPASLMPAGPAPAFLQANADPAPAPAPAPAAPIQPDVQIFVTFGLGRKVGSGQSTMVDIAFLDTPNNKIDDVAAVVPFLDWAEKSGLFKQQIDDALGQVAEIKPQIRKLKMGKDKIEPWNINKCEKHIKGIVNEFTKHYTRRQVPVALYNECTNFIPRMSFSHDYVLDPQDTVRCRRATRKFAKHWKNGQNAKEDDFEEICFNACEAKYGRNAPTCNLNAGDKLIKQPLL